jgi:hypothetical protein
VERLTDEELRDVLARAEEIERATRHGDRWNAELAAVIGAAEEVGLSRRAVERALAERLNLPATPPVVGALTWARSADGKAHVAEVLSLSQEEARVRFLRGGEHRVTLDELRPCAFLPGERVACHWPKWGPWTCTVVAYDSVKQRVKLSDGWGYTRTFPVSEVWLPSTKDAQKTAGRRVYAFLVAGATAGALIASIITALLMR